MGDKIKEKKLRMLERTWQRVGNVLLCALVVLFISACGKAPIMTREYVIEHGFLTEDELYGIDFESMAMYYNLYEGFEDKYIKDPWPSYDSFRDFLLRFKGHWCFPGDGLFYDYWLSSVDKEQEESFTEDDVDQIKAIGLYDGWTDTDFCLIFDFEQNKAYFWRYYFFGDEPTIALLTEDQIGEIKDLFRSCHVYNWDEVYQGKERSIYESDAHVEWRLYYVLEDGRFYSHQGWGQTDYAPDSYFDLFRGLRAYNVK